MVKSKAVCTLSMHFSRCLHASDLFCQVLDYWTVEVSSSYVSTGMENLPEGKGKSGFIRYGVQLALSPGRTPCFCINHRCC